MPTSKGLHLLALKLQFRKRTIKYVFLIQFITFISSDLSTNNLQYLTSRQALADLGAFVLAMKEEYNLAPTQKWIAFGGSYPGSLAAWAREKYPDLIHGAISTSGPLLAKLDFTGKELRSQRL